MVAMWLSAEFVNNLIVVLDALASQISTSLDTLNFALAVDRNAESDARMTPRQPRNSRHGMRPRITKRITSDRSQTPPRTRTQPVDTSSTWYVPVLSPPRHERSEVQGLSMTYDQEVRPGLTSLPTSLRPE